MFRFIIEYSSLTDFGPYRVSSIFIRGFLKDDNFGLCSEIFASHFGQLAMVS